MTRIKISAFYRLLSQSNPYLREKNSYVHSFIIVLRKATILMHLNLLHPPVKMRVPRLKVLILTNPTDRVHPKTSHFSTRHIILVNYKVVSQLFQLIFLSFSYLNSVRHFSVIELCLEISPLFTHCS